MELNGFRPNTLMLIFGLYNILKMNIIRCFLVLQLQTKNAYIFKVAASLFAP